MVSADPLRGQAAGGSVEGHHAGPLMTNLQHQPLFDVGPALSIHLEASKKRDSWIGCAGREPGPQKYAKEWPKTSVLEPNRPFCWHNVGVQVISKVIHPKDPRGYA